ncbi:hypothetical protein [Streptomyces sp. NPDC057696]|uniref:hypothetical protein n=1 Tax=unclassified Streptomyces TaxID=2593676 RepID=UPI0036B6A255
MRQPGVACGSTIGVDGALLAGGAGQSLPVLSVSLSPLRRMRELPSYAEPAGEGDPAAGPSVPREL